MAVDLTHADTLTWGELFGLLDELDRLQRKPEKKSVSGSEMYSRFVKD